jgi:transposase-like protein
MMKTDPFKGFHRSPEIIRLAVMMYVRFPLSLRNVEDLLHESGITYAGPCSSKAKVVESTSWISVAIAANWI